MTATNLNARPIPHPPWLAGVIEDVDDPNLVPKGTLAEAENFVPERAPRLAARGGSRIMLTLHDDQGSPAELSHVVGGAAKAQSGALVVGWSSATTKHYAYALTSDMAFAGASEALSRTAFGASWNRATPARPVFANLFEKHYVCDAQTDYSIRNPLEVVDGVVPPGITEPTFEFVPGGAGAAVLKPYCLEEYNNVLFIAGYGDEEASGGDAPALVRHSFLGKPPEGTGGFDKDAYNTIGAKGARVTAMRKGRGLLLIAKENELYRVSGFGRAYPGWQYQVEGVDNTQGYGVENPLALDYAEGFWFGVGKEGPFRTNGFAVESLMGPRQRTWKGIDKLSGAFVRYHPERRLVLFGVHVTSGAPDTTWPWILLAWDCARNVWQPNWRILGSNIRFTSIFAVATTTTVAPGSPPSAPFTDNITTASWRANWTNGDATAETEYWEKDVTGGGAWTLVATIAAGTSLYNASSPARTDHNEYHWKVRHKKGGVFSDYCAEQTVKTLIAPPTPTFLSCTGFAGSANMRWKTLAHGTTTLTVQKSPHGAATWSTIHTYTGDTFGTQHDTVELTPDAGGEDFRVRSSDAAWPTPDSLWAEIDGVDC